MSDSSIDQDPVARDILARYAPHSRGVRSEIEMAKHRAEFAATRKAMAEDDMALSEEEIAFFSAVFDLNLPPELEQQALTEYMDAHCDVAANDNCRPDRASP